MMKRYARATDVVALSRGDTYYFVRQAGEVVELPEVNVASLAHLLAQTALPIDEDALLELCDRDTVALLLDHSVLRLLPAGEPAAATEPAAAGKPCRRLVLGLTGAIAVLESVPLVLALSALTDQLDIVLTRGACKLVQPTAFEYYGHRTWTDAFTPREGARVPHIHLAHGADLVLIAPASAATLARLATGACSDLLSLVVAATRAPVVIAPAMNTAMWEHPPIARNVAQLRADGIWLVEPGLAYEVGQDGYPAMMGGMGLGRHQVAAVVRAVLERRG